MRLLFDQNISFKLVRSLNETYPDSAHIQEHGLTRATDLEIWNFAKEQGYSIVSKDEDFHQLSFLYGHPPKAILIDLGNCTTSEIELLLRKNHVKIKSFLGNPDGSYLVLQRSEL